MNPKILPLDLVPEEVLILAAEAEEAHVELASEAIEPRTLEEELESVAEFVGTLPVELQGSLTQNQEPTGAYYSED